MGGSRHTGRGASKNSGGPAGALLLESDFWVRDTEGQFHVEGRSLSRAGAEGAGLGGGKDTEGTRSLGAWQPGWGWAASRLLAPVTFARRRHSWSRWWWTEAQVATVWHGGDGQVRVDRRLRTGLRLV